MPSFLGLAGLRFLAVAERTPNGGDWTVPEEGLREYLEAVQRYHHVFAVLNEPQMYSKQDVASANNAFAGNREYLNTHNMKIANDRYPCLKPLSKDIELGREDIGFMLIAIKPWARSVGFFPASVLLRLKKSIEGQSVFWVSGLNIHHPSIQIGLIGDSLWSIEANDNVTNQSDAELILLDAHLDRLRKLERAKLRTSALTSNTSHREPIPEEVRHAVWRRDEGRCVKCGNQERLEFDHIIPLSRGGANTERNLQLLCEFCNRSKGNII